MVINIGLIIIILFVLILVILNIIIFHHWKISRYNKKLAQKKEAWEPVLFEYLSGDRTVEKTAAALGNDYKIIKDFIVPYLRNLSGKDHQLLKKLAHKTGLTDYYLKKLEKGSNTKKIKAANFLGKVEDKRALKFLRENLNNNDKDVMTTAAWAIAEIGEVKYFTLVLNKIINQTQLTYEGITELFIQFGEDICKKIENLLLEWLENNIDLETIYQTNKPVIISLLIDLLGHFNYVQGTYLFQEILNKETDSEIIIHIFKALNKIGQPVDLDLKSYLQHENWVVRSQAVRYAGIIKEQKYLSIYKELLQEDDNWWVKYYAGETILKMGKMNVLKSLAETQTAGSKMSNYILNQN